MLAGGALSMYRQPMNNDNREVFLWQSRHQNGNLLKLIENAIINATWACIRIGEMVVATAA